MSRSTIVLYGHFGSGNIGNDSSLEGALLGVRARLPDARIVCVCDRPDRVTERFGVEATPIDRALWRRYQAPADSAPRRMLDGIEWALEQVRFVGGRSAWFRDASLFVVVGTGAVDDMAVRRPWHSPYDLFKWCAAARLGGARVVFLSVGVGPIQDSVSRRLMFAALRLAHWRSYRETAAVDYLRGHGFDTSRDALYPDLAFSLDATRWAGAPDETQTPVRVGIGLINYRGWQHHPVDGEPIFRSYMGNVKAFLQWLLVRGHTVRLLVGDAIDGVCVRELIEFMQSEPLRAYRDRVVAEEISTVDGLLEQIAQTDVVVASRFHNVLSALMMKKPVVSVGYHEKNDLLMKDFGLADLCQHIESLDMDRLKEQFEQCIARRSTVIGKMEARLRDYRRQLDAQYSHLVAMHEGPK